MNFVYSQTCILTQIEHLIEPSIFAMYFDTLGVRDMQFRNQFVLSMLM